MRENVSMIGGAGLIGTHVNILGAAIGQSLLRPLVKKRVGLRLAAEWCRRVLRVHEATLRSRF
jgi:hypothetical protein